METPTHITVDLSALKVLGGQTFFALLHGYLKARSVDGVAKVTNREAAEVFGVTPRYVTSAVNALRRSGLITEYRYDGRNRVVQLAP
jgi:DNA-binding MarR family transcriptional regulator